MNESSGCSGSYAAALQYLRGLQPFGARPGLETTRALAAALGQPQERLRFIHVAGTNGKGSTCALLESAYRAAGHRVGLFTSPHLVSFRERIQINRTLIPAAAVGTGIARIRALLAARKLPAPTLFEVTTALALDYFAAQRCDVVIWETGLGGRLDATNIVTPLASVITNIGWDHQAWLGDTLAAIAGEKAGIIKPGIPVFTSTEAPEALAVIATTASRLAAPLTKIHRATSPVTCALRGAHQVQNATLAAAVIAGLQARLPVTAAQQAAGFAQVTWPGRLQLLRPNPTQEFLLDGAHNPDGIHTLRAALEQDFAARPRTLILGVLADKDWRNMSATLAPLATRIITVPVTSPRTVAAADLADACRAAHPGAAVTAAADLTTALGLVARDPFVVLAGSLYLIGAALAELDPQFQAEADERALNEWSGPPQT